MAPPQVLPRTEVHVIHSHAVGDDFEITVLPPMPELQAGATPVVYGTDANGGIGTFTDIVNLLVSGAEIPPVTLIGVGYPIGGDFSKWIQLRTRDFTPTVDQWHCDRTESFSGLPIRSGGGAAFLEFLTTELRPWVAANYEVTDDATYAGDSLGGLFGTYALLTKPESFNRYIIGSPWLCWDPPSSFEREAAYAASHDDLDATVFLAAGGAEDVLSPALAAPLAPMFASADTAALTERLANRLVARNYPSLRLTTRIFAEETHYTVPCMVYSHGLREVFKAERIGRS